jgi:hypothetical protein
MQIADLEAPPADLRLRCGQRAKALLREIYFFPKNWTTTKDLGKAAKACGCQGHEV